MFLWYFLAKFMYVSEYKQGTGLENVAEFAYELNSLRVPIFVIDYRWKCVGFSFVVIHYKKYFRALWVICYFEAVAFYNFINNRNDRSKTWTIKFILLKYIHSFKKNVGNILLHNFWQWLMHIVCLLYFITYFKTYVSSEMYVLKIQIIM